MPGARSARPPSSWAPRSTLAKIGCARSRTRSCGDPAPDRRIGSLVAQPANAGRRRPRAAPRRLLAVLSPGLAGGAGGDLAVGHPAIRAHVRRQAQRPFGDDAVLAAWCHPQCGWRANAAASPGTEPKPGPAPDRSACRPGLAGRGRTSRSPARWCRPPVCRWSSPVRGSHPWTGPAMLRYHAV